MDLIYNGINDSSIRNIIIISLVMIFVDIITGYLKAIKNKKD